MIQLFFFMSMTALAAILLNMFWYLEDSRKEENEFHHDRRRANRLVRTRSSSAVPGRSSAIPHHGTAYAKYEKAFSVESCRPVNSSQVQFYGIGTSVEVPSLQSFTENQSKSA